MSSLRHAAGLLARTKHFPDLAPLFACLGFGDGYPIDAGTRRDIGVNSTIRRATVFAGAGALRAMALDVRADAAARDELARVASQLATRSPQLLWLVAVAHPSTHTVALAVPAPGQHQRVFALVIDIRRVTDSDAETFAAMIAAAAGGDLLVHHRWRELLGRDSLTRRFYRELERVVRDLSASAHGTASAAVRGEIALLYSSRLLFLAFLEAKGWLNEDREFLRRSFDERCGMGGGVHRRLLEPLFFGTLNTPVSRRAADARALGNIPFLNGGLFARTRLEKMHRSLRFPDESLGMLVGGLLARYRVTVREDSTTWSEAAVDPEMLGRAFESLMASDERRASGTFYTPSSIIVRLAREGLEATLSARGVPAPLVRRAMNGEAVPDRQRAKLRTALHGVRVLDPACGSGSFLVYTLEQLADLAKVAGDERPVGERRLDVLTRSIFGVDVNPTAVWLCELRLWLSVVIESGARDPLSVTPLPNLDRQIRVGDALSGPSLGDSVADGTSATVETLRERYARSTGARKRSLARALDREERLAAIAATNREGAAVAARRREILLALRSRDLFAERTVPTAAQERELLALRRDSRAARSRARALRGGAPLPFSFPVHFTAAADGFDLVIGNPPWVRLRNIPPAAREALRTRYRSLRDAAWIAGATETGASRGFAAQADLASLFVERSVGLARVGGTVALLVPAKLWRSLAGGGVRRVLSDDADVLALEDWSGAPSAFDAVVYPSSLLARRVAPARATDVVAPPVRVAIHRRDDAVRWEMPRASLALEASEGAPWLLLPGDVRAAFDRLLSAGTPLARSLFGRPLLGVKTGCNEAFIVNAGIGWRDAGDRSWSVGAAAGAPRVEPSMLRPVLRGESVRAWQAKADGLAMVWTHDALDAPRPKLPAGAAAWLAPWRHRLQARTDARMRTRWWGVFRTESARHDRPRVVWSDIGLAPRALVLDTLDPTVPLNTCYVVRAPTHDDALALCAILNSHVAASWLAVVAEPARGGYHRFLGWTMARLPLPRDWLRARQTLAPLARAAIAGEPPDETTLTTAVTRAYGVRPGHIAALLEWRPR